MGFRYRKSINFGGGFRINISKSGVGYSWGFKGYRITKTAKGNIRKTVSIPGTGISFVDEIGKGRGVQQGSQQNRRQNFNSQVTQNHCDTEDIVNSVATDMVSHGLEDVLAAARGTIRLNIIAAIGYIISLLLIFKNSWFILPFLGFGALLIYSRTAGRVKMDYVIDDDMQEYVSGRVSPMIKITDSMKVWRIMQSSKVIDKKYSSGASNLIKRVDCKPSKKAPFPFKSNTIAASFKSGNETLVFMPDMVFIIQGVKIGALSYSDMTISEHTTNFIETESVPRDANVVGRTWKYINKSGGPDNRFKDNRELPICRYGEMELKSASGLNTVLMFSDASEIQE